MDRETLYKRMININDRMFEHIDWSIETEELMGFQCTGEEVLIMLEVGADLQLLLDVYDFVQDDNGCHGYCARRDELIDMFNSEWQMSDGIYNYRDKKYG